MQIKRKINIILIYYFFFLSYISIAQANEIILFELNPGYIPYNRENNIFSIWNPKNTPEIHKPGLKLFFFGKAEGCVSDAKNGRVISVKPDLKKSNSVGLHLSDKGKVFVPIPERDRCNVTEIKSEGSYIYIDERPEKGGIGIFTASGIDEFGDFYFFQSRDECGVGDGVNKFEKSTAVTWKLEREKVFPFREGRSLRIMVRSSVLSLPQYVLNRELPVQVRQQIEIGFANRDCLKGKATDKILCINKYVFDFLVIRWGGKPLDEKRGCLIFVDRAQGGLPHISCYSKPSGMKILERRSQLDMAVSCGEGLQQTTFKDKNFCYIISWTQFLNSLKAIASNHLNKPIQQITDNDLQSLFTKSYSNPDAWYITVVSFQQELHDPYKDKNVYIGGNIKELKILQE